MQESCHLPESSRPVRPDVQAAVSGRFAPIDESIEMLLEVSRRDRRTAAFSDGGKKNSFEEREGSRWFCERRLCCNSADAGLSAATSVTPRGLQERGEPGRGGGEFSRWEASRRVEAGADRRPRAAALAGSLQAGTAGDSGAETLANLAPALFLPLYPLLHNQTRSALTLHTALGLR